VKRARVVIVGGGVMGCACALELARAGSSVLVLERSVPGAEASSAAAGILGAQVEAHHSGPLALLSAESRKLYPALARSLTRATGIDVEFRECGVLKVAATKRELRQLENSVAWQKPRPRRLDGRALLRLEPSLETALAGGVEFAGDARIDPPKLLRALHIAAERAGAEFRSGAYVKRIVTERGRARGVALDDGHTLPADHVVVAAGSWTTLVEGTPLPRGAVIPARGQIVELYTKMPALKRVVFGPGVYLVPRDDGRLLLGSTLEFVGYQRDVTASAVRDLLTAAIRLVPSLAEASVRGSWSNFRPYTKDELPLIGRSAVPGVLLATGHYRNGILLAPITAKIVSALVRGRKPPVLIEDFAPARVPQSG
jgi:glycine oxidase